MPPKKAYQAILESKCPKCRKGHMFKYPVTTISKFTQMYKHCTECGFRFEVEPGFFIGAMYISYAITVAIMITTGVALWFLDIVNVVIFVSAVFASIVVLLPFIFRYSRVLFLHLFGGVKYDPGQ